MKQATAVSSKLWITATTQRRRPTPWQKTEPALLELVERYADADLFRELGQHALQRLMEMESEQVVGAGHHERSGKRTTRIATDIAIGVLRRDLER